LCIVLSATIGLLVLVSLFSAQRSVRNPRLFFSLSITEHDIYEIKFDSKIQFLISSIVQYSQTNPIVASWSDENGNNRTHFDI
jgi:hypothetical protein